MKPKNGKQKHVQLNPAIEREKLGKRIKELRIAKGYKNYEQFAYKHEINRAQYGQYENGANLKFESLIKVLNALEITLSDFFSQGFD